MPMQPTMKAAAAFAAELANQMDAVGLGSQVVAYSYEDYYGLAGRHNISQEQLDADPENRMYLAGLTSGLIIMWGDNAIVVARDELPA